MNSWYRDARFREGEAKSIAADQAQRDKRPDLARRLHREAAEAFAELALSVAADHPHTLSDLAIAATASFACAGCHARAVDFARQMLAERSLSARGRGELALMVAEYERLVPLAAGVASTD